MQGNALLALASAVLWGGGDFSGGMGVRRAGGSIGAALRVVLLSHFISFTILIAVAMARGEAFPHGAPLAWGFGAGVAVGVSLVLFYLALSRGSMGTSAAISGLLAAAIPAIVSIAIDGAPSLRRASGFMIAGLAIWLIAAGPSSETDSDSTAWMAIVAGAGFGIYFVALKFAGVAGVVWPMAICRMGSLTICSLMLLGLRGSEPVKISRNVFGWAASAALLDTSGNMMFIAATRAGRLDVAAVLGSLYPALTILLAAFILHERLTRRQGFGMVVAVGAVVLITL
jgi:drug/metabolite transporter (DMT)-like permease